MLKIGAGEAQLVAAGFAGMDHVEDEGAPDVLDALDLREFGGSVGIARRVGSSQRTSPLALAGAVILPNWGSSMTLGSRLRKRSNRPIHPPGWSSRPRTETLPSREGTGSEVVV